MYKRQVCGLCLPEKPPILLDDALAAFDDRRMVLALELLKELALSLIHIFVTDLGMTGPKRSVLGIRPEHSINLFLGGLPRRYEEAEGNCKLNACLFTIDTEKKRCVEVRRADLEE